jgi:glycerol-3-phosphate dehydrogenase
MTPSRARRKFPQLANNIIKYCSVFYEGIHDDARTNLAIAMTAAREGAIIANYCEAIRFLHARDDPSSNFSQPNRVVGAVVRDRVTDTDFVVRAKSVLFCGGPFTDELRQLEDPSATRAVTGASGIHIVLPGYFAPTSIGLVDMSTSDGRFLFFLPWNGHVLVGTTDHKCEPTMRPVPDESVINSYFLAVLISHMWYKEILWLLNEASKYISPELQLRRQDVLSAWAGIRPLAKDPQAQSTAAVSRDHVVSHNPDTSVVFVSGGKWTTYREM